VAHAQKNELKPHLTEYWCLAPPKRRAGEFAARMEDVLDLYQQPLDASRPVVCMDEAAKQLVAEVHKPLPAVPGRAKRIDYEYRRTGTASVFMFLEPLAGRRLVSVRDRRTARDWAHEIKRLLDEDYPDADVVRVVLDNLNTHRRGVPA